MSKYHLTDELRAEARGWRDAAQYLENGGKHAEDPLVARVRGVFVTSLRVMADSKEREIPKRSEGRDAELEDKIRGALRSELRARLNERNHEPNACCLHASLEESVEICVCYIDQLHGPDRDLLIRRLVLAMAAEAVASPKAAGAPAPGARPGSGGRRR